MLTIKDIAMRSGVGVSTVSRVLNNRPDVRPETREKVMAVVSSCGYTQNSNAKNLKQRSSRAVSLIVRGLGNSFLYHTAELILSCGRGGEYSLLVEYIGEKEDEFETARQHKTEKKIEGIIFLGASLADRRAEIAALGVPCVFSTVDASRIDLPGVSSVSVDSRLAARQAVERLFALGHRRIAVFGGRRDVPDAIGQRYLGVLDAYAARGWRFDEELYVESGFSLAGAHRDMEAFLRKKRPFTAVFAVSDIMAIGVIRALKTAGYCVPEDVSVVGFDGIELGQYFIPALSTIRQPAAEISRVSVELMLEALQGLPGRHVTLPTEMIEGASVRALDDSVGEP